MTGDLNRPKLVSTTDMELPGIVAQATGDEAVWQAARVRQRLMNVVESESRVRRVGNGAIWMGMAAALLIGIFGVKYLPNVLSNPHILTGKTYVTNTGERANITLEDGSQVVLAPSTTIHVSGRSIELKGEAVFVVGQQASNAFVVKAGNTVTRVLGTKFGVRAYDGNVRVVVQSGKVGVRGPLPATTILSNGDVVIITDNGAKVQHGVDVGTLLSWTTGVLQFRDMPIQELLTQLSYWYGLKFNVVNPAINSRVVTGRFTNEGRNEVIHGLELLLDAQATVKGDTVTLR